MNASRNSCVADAASPVAEQTGANGSLRLSVVVPILDEQDSIGPLAAEIAAALEPVGTYEIICVDDGSSDASLKILLQLRATQRNLRIICHDRRAGQSAALRSGIRAARGRLIATLDGDGQNDPADIPKLLAAFENWTGPRPVMVTGHRVHRRDSRARRRAAALANAVRKAVLRDDNPDTGCSLKLYERDLFLQLPYFDHMHRYLPALAKRENCSVAVVPVNHRRRKRGRSKYTNLGRLLVGIPDLLGVMWLIRRSPRSLTSKERQ